MQLEKGALRRELLLRRQRMDKSSKKKYDDFIHTKLTELVAERRPERVLCYISTETEVDTTEFLQDLLQARQEVYAPRCFGKEMKFIRLSDLSHLKTGAFGIPEPEGTEELRDFSGSLCVTPALAFSRDGYRIGYGGGYYDRFLKNYPGLSVGICWHDFLEEIPHDSFDVPVQLLVTDRETLYITSERGS